MRSPNVKALLAAFPNLTHAKAVLIKKIARSVDEPGLETVINKCCPTTEAYVRSMYSDPYNSHMWRVTVALHAINDLVGGYGVEGLGPGRSGDYAPPFEYVNMGDTYATTLVYRRKTDTLSIGNWGDIVEAHPSWS